MKMLFATICMFALSIPAAYAGDLALLKSLPKTASIRMGDEILFDVLLRAEGETYNAVEGVLRVEGGLQIARVLTGNSLVSVWLEHPNDYSPNEVRFSGIVPAGYGGSEGTVFSVVFTANAVGSGQITLEGSNLFLHDGTGASEHVGPKSYPLSIGSLPEGESPYRIAVKDTTPPEPFVPQLVRDPNIHDGKATLAFSAVDKGSGVAYYEVVEGRRAFQHVESPYLLENQALNGKIYVRAYDGEDNVREAEVRIPGKVCVGVSCFGFIDIAVLVGALLVILILWLQKKRSRAR